MKPEQLVYTPPLSQRILIFGLSQTGYNSLLPEYDKLGKSMITENRIPTVHNHSCCINANSIEFDTSGDLCCDWIAAGFTSIAPSLKPTAGIFQKWFPLRFLYYCHAYIAFDCEGNLIYKITGIDKLTGSFIPELAEAIKNHVRQTDIGNTAVSGLDELVF